MGGVRRTENEAALAQSSAAGVLKREHPFPLRGCSNFVVSFLYKDERCLFFFSPEFLVDFLFQCSQCAVSVAEFAFLSIKGVLQE